MDVNLLRILVTIVSFILFVGIVVWAWRKRNTTDFKEAANLPFDED
jgi:cytochrome c oxidase cbb3-type subunit 4